MPSKSSLPGWHTCSRCKYPVQRILWSTVDRDGKPTTRNEWSNRDRYGFFCHRDRSSKHVVFLFQRDEVLAGLNKILDGNRTARSLAGNEVRGNTQQSSTL